MTLQMMRRVGVIAVAVTGGVHLQQYLSGYQSIPTIGPLFLLNAIGAAVVAVGLLLPVERWFAERRGEIAVGLLALGGVAIGVGSLIALYIAETSTLFGFSEGTLETVMWIAIVAEAAAVALLGPVAVANLVQSSATRPTGGPRPVRS
ncbi:MAG TPA: hypothetical protein VJU80_07600 [Solirubrobacteraceae bacterium]|nr:hypothetical protein [Solirubrobacteraceae bacterium]